MEEHDFLAGTNGLCERCGKTRKDCLNSNEIYITGMQEVPGLQVNKAIIFFDQIPENCKVQQVACSKYNTFILNSAGQLFSWGETTNALGRVLERRDDAKIPKIIDELKSQSIVWISCGESHVLALEFNKQVWSWGFNKFGQLGQGDFNDRNLPTLIESIKNIVKVTASCNFSYAVTENGRVYAWGENKNFQLGQMVDENGIKQNKFFTPKLIENSPWDKTADIEIAGGANNNFFYKNKTKNEKNSGFSSYEAKAMQLENQELKRKVEFLTKKVAILEEELYKNDPDQNSKFGLTQDTALQEMQNLLKANQKKLEEVEKKMKELDEEILRYTQEIKELDLVIGDLELKESNYRDEIEARDNDLIKISSQKNKTFEKIAEIRAKKEMSQEFIRTIENTKISYYNELHLKQETLDMITKVKSDTELEVIEGNKREIVFKQMISTREREIQRKFYLKKQESVDHEIIQIVKIHQALKETQLELVSKNVNGNLSGFIEISNNLLGKILSEINIFKIEAKKSPLKSLSGLWDVVEDNIELRKQINSLTEGLLFHSAIMISEIYSEPTHVPSSNLVTPLDYAKKVLGLGNLKLPSSNEVLFNQRSKSPIRKKLSNKRKWRFC